MKLKTKIQNKKKWYCAKDLFNTLGKKWHSSILDRYDVAASNRTMVQFPTKVGNKTCQIFGTAIDQIGVDKILDELGTTLSTSSNSVSSKRSENSSSTQLDKMSRTIDDLKVILSQLVITKGNDKKITLPESAKNVSITNDPIQAEARKQIRATCEEYAKKRASDYGITDSEQRRIFFDLTYKALYTRYKEITINHTDLQELAHERSKIVGHKVSALRVAEQLGLAVELLQLANKIYKH